VQEFKQFISLKEDVQRGYSSKKEIILCLIEKDGEAILGIGVRIARTIQKQNTRKDLPNQLQVSFATSVKARKRRNSVANEKAVERGYTPCKVCGAPTLY